MGPIEIIGLNPNYDLYLTYLEELDNGLTDLEFEEWKEEIMNPSDVDWEMLEYELEAAEQDDEEFFKDFDKNFEKDFDLEECYKDCRAKE